VAVFRHPRDAALDQPGGLGRQRHAGQPHRAGARPAHAGKQLRERHLTVARHAGDGHDLAGAQLQRDGVEAGDLGEGFLQLPAEAQRALGAILLLVRMEIPEAGQRGEALGGRVTATGRGATAEFADFLMLLTINRFEPILAHVAASGAIHPEDLYQLCASAAGELTTFTTASKRPPAFPAYQHERLRESFEPVIASLRESLSKVLTQTAISIPLEPRRFGISVAIVPDRSLFSSAVFILAARADVPAEELRRRFPSQLRIGPAERISDLVRSGMRGVPVHAVPVAPRQIPYHAGFAYFELDQTDELWDQLQNSGGVAMHVAGEFPGLAMEFWAIRSDTGPVRG